ncbi:MAG: hypothetical protein WBD22_10785 [Pyrinomonadaceae bacterium]
MATTFYGPWHVVLGLVNSHFSQRFIISGSDNSDGIYPVAFGNTLVLAIQGGKWQIEVQYFPFDPGSTWQPSDVRESMKFVPGEGLILQLDGAARPPVLINPKFHNLALTCTSMDPEINPIPTANPYDFTFSEDAVIHREKSDHPNKYDSV